MSLNKTLDRLFDEIRREAKRNPEFADRLDAVLRVHSSRRDVADEVIEEVAAEPAPAAPAAPIVIETPKPAPKAAAKPAAKPAVAPARAPAINPVGLFQRGGEAALAAELAKQDRDALLALVAEHNLDPGGEAGGFDREALAAHVVAQAKRRAERDSKLFDY